MKIKDHSKILQSVFAALVKLRLDFPCSENRSKERDKRLFVWLTTQQGQRGALFARVAFFCLLFLAKQEKQVPRRTAANAGGLKIAGKEKPPKMAVLSYIVGRNAFGDYALQRLITKRATTLSIITSTLFKALE
ncbi:hypothetical protein [Chitinibacter sp. ZOR0017]|uniref:hypothetical protein n=1 Tax=Chitinibacter sp. ZOR0017 TaxID=1339254 RepID=UPI0012E00CA8|nr:hypothetical protein [Chitinibacter sp. ZOR0017]